MPMTHLIPPIVCQKLLQPNRCSRPAPVQGGLSRSLVFRCARPQGSACLRAWPSDNYPSAKLQTLTAAIRSAREGGLDFIPAYFHTPNGSIHVRDGRRAWELTEWLPGTADYTSRPNPSRLESAVTALARLHEAWRHGSTSGTSPAYRRRVDILAHVIASGEPTRLYRSTDRNASGDCRACSRIQLRFTTAFATSTVNTCYSPEIESRELSTLVHCRLTNQQPIWLDC